MITQKLFLNWFHIGEHINWGNITDIKENQNRISLDMRLMTQFVSSVRRVLLLLLSFIFLNEEWRIKCSLISLVGYNQQWADSRLRTGKALAISVALTLYDFLIGSPNVLAI